jgi:hypothetical protein
MTLNRSVLSAALVTLAASEPVYAQHRGGHAGAAGGHPGAGGGQMHPGGMNPRQQQQHFVTPEMQLQQFMYFQMMQEIARQDARRAAQHRGGQAYSGAAPTPHQRHSGGNQVQRSMGATVVTPAKNQCQRPARKDDHRKRNGDATGTIQTTTPLVLQDQEPAVLEESGEPGSLSETPAESESTEQTKTPESGTLSGVAEDAQSPESKPMSAADDANGAAAPGAQTNSTSGTGDRRPIRVVVPAESIQIAEDQEIVDLLKTAHAKLRRTVNRYAGHRDRALEQIASALSELYPWVTLPSAATSDRLTPAQPDSDSDRILGQALRDLAAAESSLSTMPDRAARHEKARAAVATARNELNAALRAR